MTTSTAVYRYFTANLITGAIVMEIPFSSVSWERRINSAGAFSGTIAADDYTNAFDLYETTIPGKYGLYVMRNDVCVWGGMIWSRSYDITQKSLSVQGAEFISYFYHRTFWKTFSPDEYQASGNNTDADTIKSLLEQIILAVSNDQNDVETDELAYNASDVHCRLLTYARNASNVATLDTEESCGFSTGDSVYIYGVPDSTFNGTYTVTSVSTDGRTFSYSNTGDFVTEAGIGAITNSYAVLASTRTLLQTQADIRITTNIDTALADYTTYASGDENPFTFRGSDGRYVGEIISNFANTGVPCQLATANNDIDPVLSIRFDYSIESIYDIDTMTFSNVFRAWLVQKDINNPTLGIEAAKPLSELYGISSSKTANSLVFEHPGNVVSMTLEESAETAATRTWVIDSRNDLDDVAAKYYGAYTNIPYLEGSNYPLLEYVVTNRDLSVISDEEVAKYAKEIGYKLAPPVGKITVDVNGSLDPQVGTYSPGDWCLIIPNDTFMNKRLAPPYENREGLLVRKIKSFSVSVPDFPTFPETVTLELVAEWEDEENV